MLLMGKSVEIIKIQVMLWLVKLLVKTSPDQTRIKQIEAAEMMVARMGIVKSSSL